MNIIKPLFARAKGARVSSKHLLILISLLSALLSCSYNPVDDTNETGTMTDIDGNVYKTVKIGNQVWTTENLRTAKYNDGSAIPHITDSAAWANDTSGGYCFYNNTTGTDSIKKYGALYNWRVIETGKLAPKGWHVSTDAEWTELVNYLTANGYNWDGSTAGEKVAKSLAAQTDWFTDSGDGSVGNNQLLNNKSGFSAFPAGGRFVNSNFYNMGVESNWWHASEVDTSFALYRLIRFDGDYVYRSMNNKSYGFPVRLVKD